MLALQSFPWRRQEERVHGVSLSAVNHEAFQNRRCSRSSFSLVALRFFSFVFSTWFHGRVERYLSIVSTMKEGSGMKRRPTRISSLSVFFFLSKALTD